jgi:hypothetical protein
METIFGVEDLNPAFLSAKTDQSDGRGPQTEAEGYAGFAAHSRRDGSRRRVMGR